MTSLSTTSSATETIERPNFDRMVQIGDLYDARTEHLLKGLNVFKCSKLPIDCYYGENGIVDNQHHKIDYIWSDSYSTKLEKAHINGEAKLSILFQALDISGSISLLQERVPKKKTIQCSVVLNMTTKNEHINFQHESLRECYVKKISHGTHIVVGIGWGSNTVVNMVYENVDESNKADIEASFKLQLTDLQNRLIEAMDKSGTTRPVSDSQVEKSEIKTISSNNEEKAEVSSEKVEVEALKDSSKLSSMGIGGKFERKRQETIKLDEIKFQFESDFLPSGYAPPTTLEQAIGLIQKIPNNLYENMNGKDKPLKIYLLPLTVLKKHLDEINIEHNHAYVPVSIGMIRSCEKIFDQIEESQENLTDLQTFLKKNRDIIIKEKRLKIENDIRSFEELINNFREDLKNRLIEVRSGGEQGKFDSCFKEFASQFMEVEDFIQTTNENLKEKVELFDNFSKKGAIVILNKNQLISAKREYRSRRVYILFLSFKEDYQSERWNGSIDHFLNLCDHQVSQEQVFLVVDKDMIPDITDIEAVPSGIRICLYLNGIYVNTNIVNEHTHCMVKCPTRLGASIQNSETFVPIRIRCPGSFVNEGCEKDLKEWKCNICNDDVKYGFDENFYCECGYESMFEFKFKCNSLMHGCEYIPFEEDRLEIQIMNMEAPKQNKVRSAIIQGQSAQKLRKIGHTLPDSGYLVIAHINIDNYTDETLTCLGAELRCGEIPFWSCSRSYYKYYNSPRSLEPGVRFKFVSHKTSYSTYGVIANCSWRFRNRLIHIYWSLPLKGGNNKLGLAITKPGTKLTNIRFKSINNSENWYGFADYCGKIDKNTKYNKLFDKSEYKIYSNESSEWIQIENDDIEIRGKMGIESDCEINIQIIPRNYVDFAPQFKN